MVIGCFSLTDCTVTMFFTITSCCDRRRLYSESLGPVPRPQKPASASVTRCVCRQDAQSAAALPDDPAKDMSYREAEIDQLRSQKDQVCVMGQPLRKNSEVLRWSMF